MQTHAEQLLGAFGPNSVPVPDVVAARVVAGAGIVLIDIKTPLVGSSPVHALGDRIRQLTYEGQTRFVINLSQVAYADSYGIGGLVAAYNWVRQTRGKIKFFAAPRHLRQVLERLRLDEVLDLYQDEASVLNSFDQPLH